MQSLGSSAISNLSLEELLPLVYGEALDTSFDDFDYGKYHHLYWEVPLAYNKEHIDAFLRRIDPRLLDLDWRDALDDILLVLLAEGILVTNEEDPWKAYYWYKQGKDYNLYMGSFPETIRSKYQKLEDLLAAILQIENRDPTEVPLSKIAAKDRDVLEYIASTQEEGPMYFTRDYQIYHIKYPPSVMSIIPVNRVIGYYIVRNGILHVIGSDEGDTFYAVKFSGDDIRLIDEIFKYNKQS